MRLLPVATVTGVAQTPLALLASRTAFDEPELA